MPASTWRIYLGVGLLLTLPAWLNVGPELQALAYMLNAFGAIVALAIMLRRHRSAYPQPWYWLLAALGFVVSGDVVTAVATYSGALRSALADYCYTGFYLALVASLVLLDRSRRAGRDRASLIDAAIIATSAGMLAWVFVLEPMARHGSPQAGAGLLLALLYPIADLALMALLVRIILSGGQRNRSLALLATGFAMVLVGDTCRAVLISRGVQPVEEGPLIVPPMLAYVFWGAAVVHPSMTRVTSPLENAIEAHWGRRRILLTTASLLAPAVLMAQAMQHNYGSVPVVAATCVVLFLLVVSRMSGLVAQVRSQAGSLELLANTDGLTHLPNRRAWDHAIERGLREAARHGEPLHVAIIDLDHFKRYNDTYGHPAGDELLRVAARAWRSELRADDLLARVGGEEFALLTTRSREADVLAVLDRLRNATPFGQTFSAGVATWRLSETRDSLWQRADKALYSAKAAGRNRVHPAEQQPSIPRHADIRSSPRRSPV